MTPPPEARNITAFRHGQFGLNIRSHLAGEAALRAVAEGIPPDADATMDLLPKGREDAEFIRRRLAGFAIDVCLRSDALRTKTTAEIALQDHVLPGGIIVAPDARERSRGMFSYAPDDWAENHPLFPAQTSVLDWQPCGIDFNGRSAESIRWVKDRRIVPVLRLAGVHAPGGSAAIASHAEWLLALRAHFLGPDYVEVRRQLAPDSSTDARARASSNMIVNGQIDMYKCTCDAPDPSRTPFSHMDQFRTMAPDPHIGEFDTGWMPIEDLHKS
jgi:broad specificity phosphatase PhoE